MEDKDFYWLVGILEGEGSFCKPPPSRQGSPYISCNMTDEDTVQRLSKLLGTSYRKVLSKDPKHKDSYLVQVRGYKAKEWMLLLKPHMSDRRKTQIGEALLATTVSQKERIDVSTAAVISLREQGLSLRQIGKMLRCGHQLVARRLRYAPREGTAVS